MNAYLTIKTLHILSSVLLVGTGFGTAFYLFFANRTGSVPVIAAVSKLVVRADLWFTTPAVVVQPLSGLWLAHAAGWHWSTPWISLSIGLYLLAGACWLPVVWLQIRVRDLADAAHREGTALAPQTFLYMRWWFALGWPAFLAFLAIFHLMVNKGY